MRMGLLAATVVCLTGISGVALGPVAPYTQRGWVTVDRWGGTYLCDRSYIVPVATSLNERFLPYRDKYVTCEVEKLTQSYVTPGPWRIDEVGKIDEDMSLRNHECHVKMHADVMTKSASDEVTFRFLVRYQESIRRRVKLEHVQLVIVKKKREEEPRPESRFSKYGITDGPSYVYLNKKLTYEMRPEENLKLHTETSVEWFVIFRKSLPPGEYDLWLMYHDPFSGDKIGTRSNTVAFSVPKPPASRPAGS